MSVGQGEVTVGSVFSRQEGPMCLRSGGWRKQRKGTGGRRSEERLPAGEGRREGG